MGTGCETSPKIDGCAHTCRDFRHYFAVNLYCETRDIYAVKEALGHATVSITEVYLAGMGAS